LIYFIGYYTGKQKYTDAAYETQYPKNKEYQKDIPEIEEEISAYKKGKKDIQKLSSIDREIEKEILESLKESKDIRMKSKKTSHNSTKIKKVKRTTKKKNLKQEPAEHKFLPKKSRHFYVKENNTTLKPYDPYLHNKKRHYSIQIGAYRSYKDAIIEKQKINYKYPTYICKAKVGEEIVYRVRVGPYGSLSKALLELQHIRKLLDRENIYVVSK
jgi:cell division protein FtsN